MAHTYTQLHIHLVFAVGHRNLKIDKCNKEELHKYITGIVQNKGNKLLAINSMHDHIHIFLGLKPDISISGLVKDIKVSSTLLINEKKWSNWKFCWQEGFGAFTYSHSHIDNVVRYILNQEKHHEKLSFKEEYIKMLKSSGVEYEEKYLFEWFDE